MVVGFIWAKYPSARYPINFTTAVDAGILLGTPTTTELSVGVIKKAVGGVAAATFDLSGDNQYVRGWLVEISGQDPESDVDAYVMAAAVIYGTGTDQAFQDITTKVSGALILGLGWDGNSQTVPGLGTGYTSILTTSEGVGDASRMEYRVAGAPGRYRASWTITTSDGSPISVVAINPKSRRPPFPTRTPSTKNIVASRKPIKTSGVRINESTATAMITRSSNLPVSTAYTMAAWVRIAVNRVNNFRYFFGVENTVPPTNSNVNNSMGWNSANTPELYVTTSGSTTFASDPPVNGGWFYASMSSNGSTVFGVWALAGGRFVRVQTTYSTLTIASMTFGNNTWDEVVGCEFAHMRVWKRALSEVELYAEMNSPFAVSKNALDTDILGYNDRRNRAPGGEWTYASVSGGTQELILSNSLDIRILNKFVIPVSTGLTVTSIVPSILYKGLTNIVITGTDFGSTQGTSQVLLDGVPQTIVDWTNTSIIFSVTSPTEWANPRVLQVARVRS
jgi:hypothetical protein